MRHRAMSSTTIKGDLEAICCTHYRSRPIAYLSRAQGHDVLPKNDIRNRDLRIETIIDHSFCTARSFLIRLEQNYERTLPSGFDPT